MRIVFQSEHHLKCPHSSVRLNAFFLTPRSGTLMRGGAAVAEIIHEKTLTFFQTNAFGF